MNLGKIDGKAESDQALLPATPEDVYNRPGLSAIRYRIGSYRSFREAMIKKISSYKLNSEECPVLQGWTSRDSDDYGIALIEMWAYIGDILTFYQERIANEAYLRTAILPESIRHLASFLDYRSFPGVAATAFLAFIVEKDKSVQIPRYLKVQSVPGENEKPQKFETVEEVKADFRLNQIQVLPEPEDPNQYAFGWEDVPGNDDETLIEILADKFCIEWARNAKIEKIDGGNNIKLYTEKESLWLKRRGDGDGEVTLEINEYGEDKIISTMKNRKGKIYPYSFSDDNAALDPETSDQTASKIAPGDKFVIFLENNGPLEEKEVKSLQVETGLTKIIWEPPVQSDDLRNPGSFRAFKLINKHRLFGYNAPLSYVKSKVENFDIKWEEIPTPYEIANADYLSLDSLYEDAKTGSEILVKVDECYLFSWDDDDGIRKALKKLGIFQYVFSWTKIPGTDKTRLGKFLNQKYHIDLASNAAINKIKDDIIDISEGDKTHSIKLNNKTEVILRISDGRTDKFIAEKENDELNIYYASTIKRSNDNKTIEIDAGNISVSLDITDSEVVLRYDGLECKLIAKMENGKQNVYYPSFIALTKIVQTSQDTAVVGPLNDTVTRIKMSRSIAYIDRRKAEIYILGPEIKFWNSIYPDKICGDHIYIDAIYKNMIDSQRTLLLDDFRSMPQQVNVTKLNIYNDGEDDHLMVYFSPKLKRYLDTKTAILWGNVARATHGETIKGEILGDGDASSIFQSFALSKDPVTFIPMEGSPHGTANSLDVWVDDLKWQEVRSFTGHGRTEFIYKTEIDEKQKMTVQFGDGISAARPSSGRGNIVANYRQGLGRDGNVRAGTLKTLLDKPLGLKSVINPGAASGGVDPESEDSIKKKAPSTIRTFDRIISLTDFEDAAREFAGIDKAKSIWTWDGEDQAIELVVACNNNVDLSDEVRVRLISYLEHRRDTNLKMKLRDRKKKPVIIEAKIDVKQDHVREKVLSEVINSLRRYFSFESRDLGLPVHLSEVYNVIQGVDGVVAGLISKLQFKDIEEMPRNEMLRRTFNFHIEDGRKKASPVQEHLFVYPEEIIIIEDYKADIVVNLEVIS